jgi:DNA invertase Pin-like site-specific DNA recombinase
MVTAFSYRRFSTKEQAKGDSVRRQDALISAWLKRNQDVQLDESLKVDDGVSAHFGKHRDNPDRYALAYFLDLVKRDRVPRGSFLLLESLDRLTREHIRPAMTLLFELIEKGIRVVQLTPVEVTYDEDTDPLQLMIAMVELSRAHSESKVKGERIGAAWGEKKRRARDQGEPPTGKCPAWLRVEDGQYVVIEDRAAMVRRIFRMARDGIGQGSITKKLNAEKVPSIGDQPHWVRAYVAKLLRDPRVIGVYQPMTYRGGKKRPDGDPVPNHYPAIVDETLYYAARAATTARRKKEGRPSNGAPNLFKGLMIDCLTGGRYYQRDRNYLPYLSMHGIGRAVGFPVAPFQQAILSMLKEIKASDVFDEEPASDDLAALAGRIAEVEGEIVKLQDRLAKRYTDAVADVLERREDELKIWKAERETALSLSASPLGEALGEAKTLVDALGSEDNRARLRSILLRIVPSMQCIFVKRGYGRLAAVQLHFAGGARRDYLVWYHPHGHNIKGSRRRGWWKARTMHSDEMIEWSDGGRSFSYTLFGSDLRDADEAHNVLSTLEELPEDLLRGPIFGAVPEHPIEV